MAAKGVGAVQHTPANPGAATFVEEKTKLDGTVQRYELLAVAQTETFAAGRYVVPAAGGPPRFPVVIPAGTVSDGYFWESRPYIVYRMRGPDGALICHRFDAVRDVRVSQGHVRYTDLVLDWWVLPDGRVIEEDEDELESAIAEGVISAPEAAEILDRGRVAESEAPGIIRELELLEARLRKFARH